VIRLTLRGYGPFRPTVHVNGRLLKVRWGTQDVPVDAGAVLVEAHVTAAADYGHADLRVEVAPGAVVPVFYTPPWSRFLTGAMGTEPQPVPGGWLLAPTALVLLAVPALVVVGFLLR
jgi:hypothetical protein